MSKKDFKANHWFVNDQVANNPSINFSNGAFKTMLADFNCKKAAEKSSLNSFFVPGWDGSSLVSHSSKQLKKSIEAIHLDVKEKFQSISNLNSKLKKALYDEFLNFADFKAINFTGINNHQDLWREIQLKDESEHKQNLDQFLEIYTYRICIVYILKIRFVAVFLKHSQQKFDLKKYFIRIHF